MLLDEKDLVRGNIISGGGGMIAALAGGVAGLGAHRMGGDRVALVAAGTVYAVSTLPARAIRIAVSRRWHGLESCWGPPRLCR